MDQNTNQAESEGMQVRVSHSDGESPANDLDWTGTPELQSSLATKAEKSQRPGSNRKRKKLFCFACNRPEGHFLASQNRWYYSFLIGMTFGLIFLVGPYQCQCCGAKRTMSSNFTSLRYWLRWFRHNDVAKPSKRVK